MYWNTVKKNNIVLIYSPINVGKWNGVMVSARLELWCSSHSLLFQRHLSSGLIFSLTVIHTYLCASARVCTTCVCPQRPKEPSGTDTAGSGASRSRCWTQVLCKRSVWQHHTVSSPSSVLLIPMCFLLFFCLSMYPDICISHNLF